MTWEARGAPEARCVEDESSWGMPCAGQGTWREIASESLVWEMECSFWGMLAANFSPVQPWGMLYRSLPTWEGSPYDDPDPLGRKKDHTLGHPDLSLAHFELTSMTTRSYGRSGRHVVAEDPRFRLCLRSDPGGVRGSVLAWTCPMAPRRSSDVRGSEGLDLLARRVPMLAPCSDLSLYFLGRDSFVRAQGAGSL